MANEPTPEAKKLLAEAANDYANRTAADPMRAADAKTSVVMAVLSAQRGAAIRWSSPPESRNGGE